MLPQEMIQSSYNISRRAGAQAYNHHSLQGVLSQGHLPVKGGFPYSGTNRGEITGVSNSQSGSSIFRMGGGKASRFGKHS